MTVEGLCDSTDDEDLEDAVDALVELDVLASVLVLTVVVVVLTGATVGGVAFRSNSQGGLGLEVVLALLMGSH